MKSAMSPDMNSPSTPKAIGMVERCRQLLSGSRDACGTPALVRLFILQMAVALTEGISLALLVPVVSSLQNGGRFSFGPVSMSTELALLALLVAITGQLGLKWISSTHSADVRVRTVEFLRLRSLDNLLHARWEYLREQRRSHIVQSVTTDVARVGIATDQLLQMTVRTLILIATCVVAIVLSPIIGGGAILIAALVGLTSRRGLGRAGALGASLTASVKSFGALVTDSLSTARLVRAHDAADFWVTALREDAARSRQAQLQMVRNGATLSTTLGVAAAIGLIAMVFVGLQLGLSSAVLLALVVVVSRILGGVRTLVACLQQIATMAPALDRVLSVTNEATQQRDVLDEVPDALGTVEGAPLLELRDIVVRYPHAESAALEDVSLVIEAGTTMAITGPSGAGKSTLLDVILGLHRPEQGQVLIHGIPLHDLASWRARVAYVPQDVILVPGTVRKNLTWSLQPGRTVTDEGLWAALRTAGVEQVVTALPHGLDSTLSETTQLSGGERQRLSIARAIARDPELLVLDEATSALDSALEADVLARLDSLGTTVVMVTHRAEALRYAQHVVRLEGGHIS